jgi:hypothetical protein
MNARPGAGQGALVTWSGLVLAAAVTLLALVGGTLAPGSVAIGLAGVAGAMVLRRRTRNARSVAPLLPAVASIAVLAVIASPSVATDLAAGVAGLAFLYWCADEPSRPEGVTRRAVPAIGMAGLAVGFAWAITLLGFQGSASLGVAVALLAVGVILMAVLFARIAATPSPSLGPTAPGPDDWPFLRRARRAQKRRESRQPPV